MKKSLMLKTGDEEEDRSKSRQAGVTIFFYTISLFTQNVFEASSCLLLK